MRRSALLLIAFVLVLGPERQFSASQDPARVRFPADVPPRNDIQFSATDAIRVAEQTVYHDGERPSHILLPVIPRRPR